MTRDEYQAIDEQVRRNVGEDFDYWRPSHREGVALHVAVKMTSHVETIALYAPPRSYPDSIESPLDPPTVGGTDISRPI